MKSELELAQELYHEYCYSIKHKNRFFVDEKYINIFKIFLRDNYQILNEGFILYRARINKSKNKEEPYDEQNIRMPRAGIVSGTGRANPSGINYFYVASNITTCICEVRPDIGSNVTIGKFESNKRLKIFEIDNLAHLSDQSVIDGDLEISQKEINERVDKIMNFMLLFMIQFSNIIVDNHEAEYSPHQYFVEFCKKEGFDGIRYNSSVSNDEDNYNYVFFDDNYFDLVDRTVHSIKNIIYEYE